MLRRTPLIGLVCLVVLSLGSTRCTAGSPEVTVGSDTLTLPWYTSTPRYEKQPHSNGAMWPQKGSKKRSGSRDFQRVLLENEYLRVEVIPEVGGVVGGAVYKPTGEDIFFREGKAKDWVPYWESGVKVNFPWREHCLSTEGQPAGWRVIRRDDGTATLAMWMEFSRHNQPWQGAMYGQFSNMLLSQRVTLHPRRSTFTITYRLTNPTPYRQGLRIWTDALLPRTHTDKGIVQGDARPPRPTMTEWIYPAAWVADHRAKNIRRYKPADDLIRKNRKAHNSVFSLDMAYGFSGLWYPRAKVNRLRVWDIGTSRAAKQYYRGEGTYRPGGYASHMYNFCELWGGVDNVMEGVENWIAPGQSYEFSHTYTMVRGLGKVDFANERLAVNVDPNAKSPLVEAVTFQPVDKLTATWNGKTLGHAENVAPTSPARFALPTGAGKGTLTVTAGDGAVLLKQTFPLEMPVDTSRHEEIKTACDLNNPVGCEMIGDQMDFGRTLDKAIQKYPGDSLGRGRVLYRKGRIDAAIKTLTAFTDANSAVGEGWHLLGVARLENGQADRAAKLLDKAVGVKKPYWPAIYYRAIIDLSRGNPDDALTRLKTLLTKQPGHWEGKLLRTALLTRSDADAALRVARKLTHQAPADPRGLWVLARAARQAGNDELAASAREALKKIAREPGADTRVKEFQAALEGRFVHPARMKDS